MNESIIVTGGAGFIGSHVCEALVSKGENVVCIDNFNDYYNPEIKEKNIKEMNERLVLYKADITDIEKLRAIFKKHSIKAIIHLAARGGVRPSIENPFIYEKVNINGTLNLLELAKEFNVKKFVFGSSSSVYGKNKKTPFSEDDVVEDQVSPYAFTKKAGELLCRTYSNLYGISIACLRFFTVYGPRGRPDMAIYKFTKMIDQDKEIEMYGDGSSKRDYTCITDIVDGILAVLEKEFKFEIINLGGGNPVELRQMISLIEKELGKKAAIKQTEMQKGDVDITYADISKAEKMLDYKPKVKIEQGINLFVKWYKNER